VLSLNILCKEMKTSVLVSSMTTAYLRSFQFKHYAGYVLSRIRSFCGFLQPTQSNFGLVSQNRQWQHPYNSIFFIHEFLGLQISTVEVSVLLGCGATSMGDWCGAGCFERVWWSQQQGLKYSMRNDPVMLCFIFHHLSIWHYIV